MKYRIVYIILMVFIMFASFGFDKSEGLVMAVGLNGSLSYAKELMSSGSDDDIAFEVGSFLFLIPVIASLIFILLRDKYFIWEYCIVSLFYILQFLLILAIEVGSIWETIFYAKNIYLAIYIVSLISSYVILQVRLFLFLKAKCQQNRK